MGTNGDRKREYRGLSYMYNASISKEYLKQILHSVRFDKLCDGYMGITFPMLEIFIHI